MAEAPVIDPKDDLIIWMMVIRTAPVDYEGTGGVARMYRDLAAWQRGQESVDDMIDVGTHMVHPRRHGMSFFLAASEHFKGYYGTEANRHLHVGRTDWGNWLEAISDSPAQALERVFSWFDLFVEIHGLQASAPRPLNPPDGRPYVDVLNDLRRMRRDPTLRPGDGSLRDALAHIDAQCSNPDLRIHSFGPVLRANIETMMDHRCNRVRGLGVSGSLDQLAEAMRPGADPWSPFMDSVEALHSNYRGLGTSQGGTRDLIKG